MDEYIEREALVVRLQEHRRFFVDAWGDFCSMPMQDKARVDELSNCIAEVFNAPAADVAPVVHGRWILKKNYHHGHYIDTDCFCSECNTLGSPQWKGCPVCLARMDGE